MKTLALIALLCALPAGMARADDMDSMKTVTKTFADAWNKHDIHALAANFSDDADLINPMGKMAKGKMEIEKLMTEEHATVMKDTQFNLTVDSMRMVDGLALCDGTATVTGMMGPHGQKMPKMDHHAFWISKKSGDTWKIVSLRPYMFGMGGSSMGMEMMKGMGKKMGHGAGKGKGHAEESATE